MRTKCAQCQADIDDMNSDAWAAFRREDNDSITEFVWCGAECYLKWKEGANA